MKPRSTSPTVATFADHEVIRPNDSLSKAVKRVGHSLTSDDEAIARAEAALAELSGEFAGWMKAECDRLDFARLRIHEAGLGKTGPDELFRAAHDIKGQAATFGYPAAAKAAESLCRLLEHTPDLTHIPLSLIDQHVDGVRAIIREDVRQHGTAIAADLAQSLRRVTDEFLLYENRHRPDYLKAIMSPPLAPKP
jgi:HPt (histidine-containing phosphotransfer) domain-containing protein